MVGESYLAHFCWWKDFLGFGGFGGFGFGCGCRGDGGWMRKEGEAQNNMSGEVSPWSGGSSRVNRRIAVCRGPFDAKSPLTVPG